MWSKTFAALAICQFLSSFAVQAATWPSSIDEIEDLMYLQTGRRSPGFGKVVTPSTNQINNFNLAAGFLRIAFHDMAAYDKNSRTGGLDASIGFELGAPYNTHNAGPAFNATINYYYDFFNSKASMADLIAAGTYTAVRSAGGPQIAVRGGRIDATGPGRNSLPDTADNASTLVGRFDKMGFNTQEMIQMVACGHTLGGLHPHVNPKNNNPENNGKDYQPFDTTDSGFDYRVAKEYVDRTTKNPLVIANVGLESDLTTFNSDGNVTIKQLANSNSDFNGACQKILARMIDSVPGNVQLTDPIVAYDAKPYALNLNVIENGAAMTFSGEIRVKGTPSSVTLKYTGRPGDACTNCTIKTTLAGTAQGFDNKFSFFGFNARVTSISSFTVTTSDGQTYTNGGKGFPVNDNAFVMLSGSSINGNAFKPVVAVRAGQGVPTMVLKAKTAKQYNALSTIQSTNIALSKICSDDTWSYYSGSATLSSLQVGYGKLDLSVGGVVTDGFRTLRNFASSGTIPKCGGKKTTTTTTQSKTSSSTLSSTTKSTLTTTSKTTVSATLTSTSSGKSNSTTTSSGKSSSTSTSSGKTSSTSTSTGKSSSTSTSSGKSSSTTTSSVRTTKFLSTTSTGGTTVDGTLITTSASTTDSTTGSTTDSTSDSTTESTTTTNESGESSTTVSTTADAAITSTTSWSGDEDSSTTTEAWTPPADDWTKWDPAPVPTTSATWSDKDGDSQTYSLPAWNNYNSWGPPDAGQAYTSIYEHHYNEPAANGGSDGGNKNIEGLNLHIIVQVITPVFAAPTAVGDYAPGEIKYTPAPSTWAPVQWGPEKTTADYPAPTAGSSSTWGPADVQGNPSQGSPAQGSPAQGSPSWAPADVQGGKPSATKTGGIAKYTGAANTLGVRGESVMMGAAAIAGAIAYLL